MKYSHYGYRIKQIAEGTGYDWLFLPGGPGLGSEYLIEFCKKLTLPGNLFLLDFPMDGTNSQGELKVKNWREGLIELLKSYAKPILVTHSFGGMFALSLPELEGLLTGLVLMNTSTDGRFILHVSEMQKEHNLPELFLPASQYHLNPSQETYKTFWDSYKYYCFTAEEMREGEQMMEHFAFNSAAYSYAIENFYAHYGYKWVPAGIPCMTIASENDFICSPQVFLHNKQFSAENISNKVISKAGHFPWLRYFAQVQNCFDDFVKVLERC